MVSIQFGVAVFTYCLIVKVFIMLSSNMVQVAQSAAINTDGVNMMTDVGGHVLQYLAAMWFSIGDMHVTNVCINHKRRRPFCFKKRR
jgi:multisubunit Na+/H+ antiporter MnhC subunit